MKQNKNLLSSRLTENRIDDQNIIQSNTDLSNQKSSAELLNDGKIDLETYHVHPDRLVITDGLGILLKPHIQTLHGKLKENDIVLMSSDGLHYAIQPDAMAAIILESKDCMEASKNLIDASKNIIKYPDNMSAMVIYREKEE